MSKLLKTLSQLIAAEESVKRIRERARVEFVAERKCRKARACKVGAKMKTSPSYIHCLESGKSPLNSRGLKRLIDALEQVVPSETC